MLDERHLRKMTDDVGMLQFSELSHPNFRSGYTLDDNARALIAALYLEDGLELALKYARFMYKAQRPDGSWANLFNNGRFLPQFNSEDSIGRALLACSLGMYSPDPELAALCEQMFSSNLSKALEFRSPRGTAYALLAMCKDPGTEHYDQHLFTELTSRLLALYNQHHGRGWYWFEDYLTYCNGIIPQALFAACELSNNRRIHKVAYESMNFLNGILFRNGRLDIIGNAGWYHREGKIPVYDQQPVDAASIIFACYEAYHATGSRDYRDLAYQGYKWYMGDNVQKMALYDNQTGGCFDALTASGVNQNQGAEAVLSLLLSTMLLLGRMEQKYNGNQAILANLS
jgi:hypothetical protein